MKAVARQAHAEANTTVTCRTTQSWATAAPKLRTSQLLNRSVGFLGGAQVSPQREQVSRLWLHRRVSCHLLCMATETWTVSCAFPLLTLRRVLAYDTDGRLCPIGINDAGLGVAVFNLHLVSTDGFSRPSLSVQSILWELLLARHTLTSALTWLRSLPPVMCGSSLLLVDQTGAVAGGTQLHPHSCSKRHFGAGCQGKPPIARVHCSPRTAITRSRERTPNFVCAR